MDSFECSRSDTLLDRSIRKDSLGEFLEVKGETRVIGVGGGPTAARRGIGIVDPLPALRVSDWDQRSGLFVCFSVFLNLPQRWLLTVRVLGEYMIFGGEPSLDHRMLGGMELERK